MDIGVVGYGTVGQALVRWLSKQPDYEISIYDKLLPQWGSGLQRSAINSCDLVFIAVPTPTDADGISCDTSIVEEVVRWVEPPICIKSTVAPGTTDRLVAETGKQIAFSPEYIGETEGHPWPDVDHYDFSIVGGEGSVVDLVCSVYGHQAQSRTKCYRTSALTAEICKYMENCYLATKVAFVNQFFDIAQSFKIDFEELRTLWLADPRIESSHTEVTRARGFGGRCLPKDVKAIIAAMAPFGGAPLLESVNVYNDLIRQLPSNDHGELTREAPSVLALNGCKSVYKLV